MRSEKRLVLWSDIPLPKTDIHFLNNRERDRPKDYNSSRKWLLRSLSPDVYLWMCFVTITLADVLPVAVVVAIQAGHCKGGCPYPAHLFIDVLAKVGYVKYATSIVQVRINQVSPEAFEHG
jgi:hypothetical protein